LLHKTEFNMPITLLPPLILFSKNIRDLYKVITESKMGYQLKTNLVKVERGDLLEDPQKITAVS
jgi:hypothetical protein